MGYCMYHCKSYHLSLVVKEFNSQISSRGPYLSSRKASNSALLLSPSHSSLHLRNDTQIFILVFFLAQSNSFFLQCFSPSVFLFLLWRGNGGAFFCSVASLSLFTDGLDLEPILPGKSTHCTSSSVCMSMIDTSQKLASALIGCVDSEAIDSCKSNQKPQTVDFFIVDLHFILLPDHYDNFSKYKKTCYRLQL